jgi:organic hydroperoxide reductase OsmC/OhrA
MHDSHEYPVTVRWIHGKEGVAESADGLPSLPISAPPQFGGTAGVWSPEHLLVAAANACLMTTFLAAADASRLQVLSYEAPAVGTLARGEDRRYWVALVEVRPRVTVASEEDRDRALRLLEKAGAACLVSRSLRTSVVLHPLVEVADCQPALV